MTRSRALAGLVLVAALAGCTRSAPQESVVPGSPPHVVATENRAWIANDAGLLKIVVVDVNATSRVDVSWHDILLNLTSAPLAPSSAYVRATNLSYGANDTIPLEANGTLRLELHYKGNVTEEPTRGFLDLASGPVVFELPAPSRASP